jgi:hypothetical protein
MPNHYTTELRIDPGTERLEAIREAIFKDGRVTFEILIPMPEILRRTHSGGATIDGQRARVWMEDEVPTADGKTETVARLPTPEEQAEIDATGAANWYDWANDHWGTKWDAYESEELVALDDQLHLRFQTAWGPPVPWIGALRRRFPAAVILARGHDEGEDPWTAYF